MRWTAPSCLPENSITLAVYDRQAVQTEAVFLVPASAELFELLVGHPDEATSSLSIRVRR